MEETSDSAITDQSILATIGERLPAMVIPGGKSFLFLFLFFFQSLFSHLSSPFLICHFSFVISQPLPDGNGRNEMGRICPSGDVVLLMLSLVLSDHETRSTRVGEECDDGRAHGHDEILDECFHVLAHKHFAPF